MVSEEDMVSAAEVREWFGQWWVDRPAYFMASMMLAKLAIDACRGDSDARQLILDGSIEEMLGIPAERAAMMTDHTLSVFASAACAGLPADASGEIPVSNTAALEWANRWQAHAQSW